MTTWATSEYTIKEVTREESKRYRESDRYSITTTDHTSFSVPIWNEDVVLAEGDVITIYHDVAGIGGTITGLSKDGVNLFYKTQELLDLEREQFLLNLKVERLTTFLKNKEAWRALVAELSAPFRARMQRFIDEKGFDEFFKEDGGYELFAVSQANVLYAAALNPELGEKLRENDVAYPDNPNDSSHNWTSGTLDWENTSENRLICWWALNSKLNDYNYELQKELIPDWEDGHSGNTAGAAYMMARRVLAGQEI